MKKRRDVISPPCNVSLLETTAYHKKLFRFTISAYPFGNRIETAGSGIYHELATFFAYMLGGSLALRKRKLFFTFLHRMPPFVFT